MGKKLDTRPAVDITATKLTHTHAKPAEWIGETLDPSGKPMKLYIVANTKTIRMATAYKIDEALRMVMRDQCIKVAHGYHNSAVKTDLMLTVTGLNLACQVKENCTDEKQ